MKAIYSLKGLMIIMAFLFLSVFPGAISGQGDCTQTGLTNAGFEAFNVPAGGIGGLGTNGWAAEIYGFMEVWGSGFGGVPAYEGIDFVELNSNGPDNIYQDLTTSPGSSYDWQVAHRGRLGVDVANLEFGPPGGPYTVSQSMADGTSAWGVYSGAYTVPAGQTTTRVRLVAVSYGGFCSSCANFVDGFSFQMADSDGDGILDCNDNCVGSSNEGQEDSDCDGSGNTCDVCPGGNDMVDNNNDGLPDCHYLPAYNDIISAWKCGPNKVLVAHTSANEVCHTICIDYGSVQDHLNHGDYIGPCGDASCIAQSMVVPDVHGSAMATNDLAVYPNPAIDEINIQLKSPGAGMIVTITDNFGRIVWSKPWDENRRNLSIDLTENHFMNGVYFVRASTDTEIYTQRFIISN